MPADDLMKSIAAFEETLVTPNSPFDRWLTGDGSALSAEAIALQQMMRGIHF